MRGPGLDHIHRHQHDQRGAPTIQQPKDTGNGHREAGQAALDVFTEWKSIYVDYSGRLQALKSTTLETHTRTAVPAAIRVQRRRPSCSNGGRRRA